MPAAFGGRPAGNRSSSSWCGSSPQGLGSGDLAPVIDQGVQQVQWGGAIAVIARFDMTHDGIFHTSRAQLQQTNSWKNPTPSDEKFVSQITIAGLEIRPIQTRNILQLHVARLFKFLCRAAIANLSPERLQFRFQCVIPWVWPAWRLPSVDSAEVPSGSPDKLLPAQESGSAALSHPRKHPSETVSGMKSLPGDYPRFSLLADWCTNTGCPAARAEKSSRRTMTGGTG